MPFSGVATYSATKAFASWISLALSDELRYMGTKVEVMNFDCGHTKTSLSHNTGNFLPETAASGMLKHMGKTNSTSGHVSHDLGNCILSSIPQSILTKIFYKGVMHMIEKEKNQLSK
jgi:short-subunit dehydrogenase